jgi:antitoxin component YwqK of YwqJK toxin-antitoxin module
MDTDDPLDLSHLVDDKNSLPRRCVPDANGWVPHGRCVAYRGKGLLFIEITYDQGIAHGPYRDYWSNGRLATEGQFVDGVQEGDWRFYNKDGSLYEIIQFKGGKEIVDWEKFLGRKVP